MLLGNTGNRETIQLDSSLHDSQELDSINKFVRIVFQCSGVIILTPCYQDVLVLWKYAMGY